MKPVTKALVFFLAIIAPLVIITLALRRPADDKTRLNELRERYTKVRQPGVDHGKFAVLQQDFDNPHQITAACLSCHTERGHELLSSPHFTWEREDFIPGKGVVYIGKKNLINNFCTGVQSNEGSCMKCHAGYGWADKSFDFKNPFNIDCIVCHDNTGTYQKASGMAGYPEMGGDKGPDFKAILASVGIPASQNCGSCHFFGGGGNNVKHGDLEVALLTSGRQVDVHMGVDGIHMKCVDCHTAENHKMKGRYFGITATGNNRLSCEDCHTSTPHVRSILNEHTIKVSCQACHIPVYAKVNATKMEWDWSTATKKLDGKGFEVKDEDGNIIYTSAKGDFVWKKNVRPEYSWFNGTADHLLITDKIDTTEGVVKINRLFGEYKDQKSKIVPVKVHRGRQPYDPETLHVLQAKLWDRQPGQGALWLDLNWDSAIIKGMEYVGLPYSGKYAFIDTEVYLPVNHMVSPSAETVSCKECHTRSEEGRLAQLRDFYMPGRDRNDTADFAGRLLLILSFVGVAGHAGIRFMASRKNRKNA
ncbi:MAG: tetrathionate reductase family octaheme c-type cytochrome [Bacteroidetes bacterium]|nr:tetrathionate reductase family octaheme c-type cytochrome [Bacteroidota bacterium]